MVTGSNIDIKLTDDFDDAIREGDFEPEMKRRSGNENAIPHPDPLPLGKGEGTLEPL